MYVCMYVCMHVCMHVCLCMWYMCTCVCTQAVWGEQTCGIQFVQRDRLGHWCHDRARGQVRPIVLWENGFPKVNHFVSGMKELWRSCLCNFVFTVCFIGCCDISLSSTCDSKSNSSSCTWTKIILVKSIIQDCRSTQWHCSVVHSKVYRVWLVCLNT